MEKSVRDNVREICARIEGAAKRAGRDPREVMLLAATKNRVPREILEAYEAGVKVVGENRVQEMVSKRSEVGDVVAWHFIGHLQRNKVRFVAGEVGLIHSVDSARLAEEIDVRAGVRGTVQPVLIQVNMAGEGSKFGLKPGQVGELIEEIAGYRNVEVRGLSTVAPFVNDAEDVRWIFRELKDLGGRLDRDFDGFKCDELSMGMTNDFEIAVEEGSTLVRIGTAIFDLN